jgi:hypothetical protein
MLLLFKDRGVGMNKVSKIIVPLCIVFALCHRAQAAENESAGAGADTKPGVVNKVEHAIEHGAKATVDGVKHGGKAAAGGLKRGGEAAAHGIEVGVKATERTTRRVVEKLDGKSDKSSDKSK